MRLIIKLRENCILEILIIKFKNHYVFIAHFVSYHGNIINFIRIKFYTFFFLLPCRRIFVLLFAAFIYHKKVTHTSDIGNLVLPFSWYLPVQNKTVSRIKHALVSDHFQLEKGQHKCLHVVTITHYVHIHWN